MLLTIRNDKQREGTKHVAVRPTDRAGQQLLNTTAIGWDGAGSGGMGWWVGWDAMR